MANTKLKASFSIMLSKLIDPPKIYSTKCMYISNGRKNPYKVIVLKSMNSLNKTLVQLGLPDVYAFATGHVVARADESDV